MATATKVKWSLDDYINGLLSGYRWDPATGPVTFGFPTSSSDYGKDYRPDIIGASGENFVQVSPEQMQAARSILAGGGASAQHTMAVAQFTELQFAELSPPDGAPADADIRLGDATVSGTATTFPYNGHSDTWFFSSPPTAAAVYGNPVLGGYAFDTHMHELGHALGLKEAAFFLEGSSDFPDNVPVDRNDVEFTVMSYCSYIGGSTVGGYTIESWGYPQSYMMLDIAALQYLYGANYNYNAGDSVYSWNPNTGEMSINDVPQGAPGANRVFLTIWDGGGRDTYDFSNYANGVQVDLTPGRWSVTSQAQLAFLGVDSSGVQQFSRGNVFNALLHDGNPRSLIENAIGGAGGDSISGNDADNYLAGAAGSDSLYGGGGKDELSGGEHDDYLDGGPGGDVIDGGLGQDMVSYWASPGGVMADLSGQPSYFNTAEGDILTNIENLDGSQFADTLSGDSNANILGGLNDNDTLFGRDGADILKGGNGNDFLYGGWDVAFDQLFGEEGDDTCSTGGGGGLDWFTGGPDNDTFTYSCGSGASVADDVVVIRDFTPGQDSIRIYDPPHLDTSGDGKLSSADSLARDTIYDGVNALEITFDSGGAHSLFVLNTTELWIGSDVSYGIS
jgi:serralysin